VKILLIKQTSLGDLIHSTIAIEAIVKQYPQAEIHFVVDKACAFAVENNPHITKFFYYDQQDYFKRLRKNFLSVFSISADILKTIRKIRKHKYDLAIDLQGIERSALFLYLCKSKRKFIKGKKLFLKGYQNTNKDSHALDELRGTLSLAELDTSSVFPKIYLHEESGLTLRDKLPPEFLDAFENKDKKVVIISPYTSWQTKDVRISTWVEAAEEICKKDDGYFIFSATPDKREQLQNELDKVLEGKPELTKRILNFAGKTNIQELLNLISMADLVMASEGAAGHMASALDTPLCVVFGPTKPSRVGPWGDKAVVIQSETAACLGCYKRKCDNWICMDFPPQKLSAAATQLWS
jgi:heptosyltransferase-2